MSIEVQALPGTIAVREIRPDDAAAYVQLRLQIDHECRFMVFQAEAGSLSPKRLRGRIELLLATDNQTIFVAEAAGELIGFLCATGGVYRHDRHNVQIVVGVLQTFTCHGIGTRLLQTCEQWARARCLYRLELSVATHNDSALALYKKFDFEVEGLAKAMLRVDDEYIDLYYMSKVLT
jgi:ribosomal protein S18 acetylase RimI-like enzyme